MAEAGPLDAAGTGALVAQSATAAGTGIAAWPAAGTGALVAQTATAAGTGIAAWPAVGTGRLVAQQANAAGTGIITLAPVSGAGALRASPARAAGAGTVQTIIPPEAVVYDVPLWSPHSGDDYVYAFNQLLPRGQAWNRDPSSVQQLFYRGLNLYWGDVDSNAALLLTKESDPRSALMLLPDWERAWGLPDPCVAEPLTIADRRLALVSKMTLLGGQSREFFYEVAAQLGYQITIYEYAPYVCGLSRCGDTRFEELATGALPPAAPPAIPISPVLWNGWSGFFLGF